MDTMTLTQPTQRELKPRLRFPEFQDAGEWKRKKLGQVATFYNGKAYKQEELLEGGKYKVLRVGNFFTNNNWYYSDLEMDDTKYCDNGDLLYAWSASFGPRIWQGEKVIYHYHIWKVIKKVGIDKKFLFITLEHETEKIKDQSANGLGLLHITKGTIEAWESSFPIIDEQQKIADCLSSIDDLITAQAQKIESLKTHKKGLMQQLFPAEGETLPKLRFPEFRNTEDWKEKLIEEFFSVGSSKRVLQQNWTTQGVPFYRTRELVSLSKKETFSSEIFISEKLFCEIVEHYGSPTEGDFLVSGVGTLGISYQVQAQDRFYFKDGNVLWFKLKGGIISLFFKYSFEADEIQNQILRQAAISTVGTYTIQNAKTTMFSCPPTSAEQQKIADCLSSIDDLIAAHTQKLDALKVHKKGLMQQLFPALDEMQR